MLTMLTAAVFSLCRKPREIAGESCTAREIAGELRDSGNKGEELRGAEKSGESYATLEIFGRAQHKKLEIWCCDNIFFVDMCPKTWTAPVG